MGRYQSRPGFSKKALGLGVGAGFLGGAGLGAAGTLATYSAYHRFLPNTLTAGAGSAVQCRYHEYRRLLAQRKAGHYYDTDYYSSYYSSNQVRILQTYPLPSLPSASAAALPPPTASGGSASVTPELQGVQDPPY